MSTATTNYGLERPASTDNYNIGVFNDNADKIDTQMKANADATSAKESLLKDAASKTAPADADKVPVIDSADSSKTKLVLFSGIKSALGSVFAALSHASTHATGGSDPLTPGDIGACTQEDVEQLLKSGGNRQRKSTYELMATGRFTDTWV